MSPGWEGVFCALWTPTDEHGNLLEAELQTNLEFLKSKGLRGLLVLGSTGEFLHLTLSLRKGLMEKAAQIAAPLPLIVNTSDLRPAIVADLGRFARQVGAQAISVLPPHFYPMAQEDLTEFFVRAAEAARLPLFLYNFPERTGNRISLATVAAVADRVPLAGVKQSGSEFGYHAELVELGRQKGFVVLTGADTRLPEAVQLGVKGCVSGLANAVPELVVSAWAGAREGGGKTVNSAQRLAELGERIQAIEFPLDVAAAMEARGLGVGAPKGIVSVSTQTRYRRLVQDLQELFRKWHSD